MSKRLRKNNLGEEYVYSDTEKRMVRRDEILPAKGKHRAEYYAFLEGARWILGTMIGFKSTEPDLEAALEKKAQELFPDFE